MAALLKSLYLLVAVACTANSAMGHDNHPHHLGCGTPDPSDEDLKNIEKRVTRYKTRHKSRAVRALCVGCVDIEVVFHVVADTAGGSDTSLYMTDANIAHQVDILNQHFRQTPFRFVNRATTRTINDEWVYGIVYHLVSAFWGVGASTELAATITAALRVGGPDVVNIFYVDGGADGCFFASFASRPNELGMFPAGMYSKKDIIFLCPSTISPHIIDYGDMAHEIGHWLGLLHTFRGNRCDASNLNDLVNDTPQQLSSANFCSECCVSGRDSCPLLPGLDPANFMDYSVCRSNFTPGQIESSMSLMNSVAVLSHVVRTKLIFM